MMQHTESSVYDNMGQAMTAKDYSSGESSEPNSLIVSACVENGS